MYKKFIDFLREVRNELKKVTWPSRSDVSASTWVIVVTTLILGVFLGIVDFGLSQGIQPMLSGSPKVITWVIFAVFGGILAWVYKIIQS